MLFHIPQDMLRHRHHALVTENVELTKVTQITYNSDLRNAELYKTTVAGIYGFHNKEHRDKFVTLLNSQLAGEIAFKISIDQSSTIA